MSNTDQLREIAKQVVDTVVNYIEDSQQMKGDVATHDSLPEIRKRLKLDERLALAGTNGDPSLIVPFLADYLETTTRLHDPRFVGHQVARPHFASAMADLVNGSTNNGMAIYEMGPAGVALESFVIDTLLARAGWQNGSGILTHGGSLANLTAMIAARNRFDPGAWEQGNRSDIAFLLPDTSHYCVQRALCILGFGQNSIYYLPTDEVGRIQVDQLEAIFQQAKSQGRTPVAVVANAGSTPTGMYDDFQAIGTFASERNLWFHIDGAHGASALISERHRALMGGAELADSLVWDQHKMMQTSALCTSLLFRDSQSRASVFQQKASYLDAEENATRPDLFHFTVECTKAPLGLKLVLTLLAEGWSGIASYVDRTYARTAEIYEYLNALPGFRCLAAPQSNILCFTYRPEQFDQFQLRERIIRDGDYYITRTTLHGTHFLRLTVMNPDTTMDHIQSMAESIQEFK